MISIKDSRPNNTQLLGASVTTPTNYNNLSLSNQLIVGGADLRSDGLATTSISLGLNDLLGNTTIIETAATSSANALTMFMPSSTTIIAVLPHAGDYVAYVVVNASTTGPTLAIASSTDSSVVVKVATSTTNILKAGAMATLDCVKVVTGGIVDCILGPSSN